MKRKLPRTGPFLALSAGFFDDPDVEPLPWDDRAFFIALGCKVRQLHSDGWLTEAQVSRIGYPRWKRALPRLIDLGLLTSHTDAHGQPAYFLPGYLKWNWSEDAWLRQSHEGRVDACKRWHAGPGRCDKPACVDSAAWLNAHPHPVRGPSG